MRSQTTVDAVTPVALVMNMFYTGLGIARSLGEQGVRVIGLSAHSGIYGNYTRYAEVRACPDSREDPEGLLEYLLRLFDEIGRSCVIFPTRDDDVVFLDRFRAQFEAHRLVVPRPDALHACLDKWETHLWAQKAGVPVPRCWKIENKQDLVRILPNLSFPCVLKPTSAHYWRKADNWKRVGARKAVPVASPAELFREYESVARADHRVILQEMVVGADDQLFIAACYLDHSSKLVAGFTAQKLAQVPEAFGTGCIVRTADQSSLIDISARLLRAMEFSGIAEVEYKWDSTAGEYKLIEINPRPWDQHRLGPACGVDLIRVAYCDLAGLPIPEIRKQNVECKWIAEDVFFRACLQSFWRRDGNFPSLWRLSRGKRIYAIWSATDPLPSLAYMPIRYLAGVIGSVFSRLGSLLAGWLTGKRVLEEKGIS